MIHDLPLSINDIIYTISASVAGILLPTFYIVRTTSLKKIQNYFFDQNIHIHGCTKLKEIILSEDNSLLKDYYLQYSFAKFLYNAIVWICLLFILVDIFFPITFYNPEKNQFILTQSKLTISIILVIFEIVILLGATFFIEKLKKNTYESLI